MKAGSATKAKEPEGDLDEEARQRIVEHLCQLLARDYIKRLTDEEAGQ